MSEVPLYGLGLRVRHPGRDARPHPHAALGNLYPGFGFRGPGFGFRVSGSGIRVWGVGFGVSGFRFGFWGLGFRNSGSGFRVPGIRFGHPHAPFGDPIGQDFQNFPAMKFTASMLYYYSCRSCCVENFIARFFQIEALFL